MKRRRAIAVLSVLMAIGGARPVNAAGDRAWTQFGQAPEHTFENAAEHLIGPGNVSQLRFRWEASFGDGSGIAPTTAVSVAHGVVFVASADDRVHALDAATGQERWYAPIEGIVDSTPAVAGGLVFVGTLNGPVEAFPETCSSPCSPVWSTQIGGTNSPPVIVGSRMYIGGYDGDLYALDAATGTVLWRGSVNLFDPVNEAPTVGGGTVFVAGNLGVYAFPTDCTTPCDPLWMVRMPYTVFASVSLAGGLVYAVDYQGDVDAIEAATGGIVWTGHIRPGPTGTAVSGGRVYVGNSWGRVSGFAATGCGTSTCATVWRGTVPPVTPGLERGLFQPSVANGVLYVGSIDEIYTAGSVFAFASCDRVCEPAWSATTDGAVEASPVVANGQLYVTTLTGNVEAFGLPSG